MHPSTALATVLVDELVRGGVREAVLAPGSRSAPLAYALEEADRRGRLRLHVRVDERSAGFLALGLARASGAPVLVVTTSGTAVANLHPAVLEAHHSHLPLVVLSADRPAELRGTGANQTTHQPGIFAGAVRWEVDLPAPESAAPRAAASWRSTVCRALAAALDHASSGGVAGWFRSGPVHLNVSFRDPLAPQILAADTGAAGEGHAGLPTELAGRPGGGPWTVVRPDDLSVAGLARNDLASEGLARDDLGEEGVDGGVDRGRAVVLLGDLGRPHLHDLALAWAERHGYPVLAEPFGRLPHGSTVVPHGVLVAADVATVDALAPERIVVVGRLTLFRELGALLRRPDVVVEQVSAVPSWTDPSHVVQRVHSTLALHRPSTSAEEGWAQRWVEAGRSWAPRVRSVAGLGQADQAGQASTPDAVSTPRTDGAVPAPPTGVAVATTVAAGLSDEDVLVLGSSNAPRDLAVGLGAVPQTGAPVVHAGRGLAGIDGTVSTAVGIALAAPRQHRPTRTVALMGDLTFLHDVGGLLLGPGEPRPDLTVVVVNDDGGGIFSTLEYGEPARSATAETAAATERIFGTPHGTDLGALCAGYRVEHRLVPSVAELAGQLARPAEGIRVLEVRVDRSGHRALRDALRAASSREPV
ncbi:2-succinyl-5-enolpyruvyl-6-hydroxy-3-cyclohexene-1-carboxylic-acid synthase [Ornithinimicrobium sufpigmenti]|uniref:2-succinyl-5-enolpyruvyl-6-hydroxy-3- cyclohexene-1-carboxylic-acid synthase n=1 Tax=Ornithinimicrobium sufpigmenti TaxID=2508882 RepID=UPI001036497B|nr:MULTISPECIES: 2-succinyl-5-enolpyruvyl-6-hydroxy-3-cyclohexene-1-carboxylic-acid synthase [unclassified Ornithinimicrobium]